LLFGRRATHINELVCPTKHLDGGRLGSSDTRDDIDSIPSTNHERPVEAGIKLSTETNDLLFLRSLTYQEDGV
jgi:hypothetical protein